MSGSQGVIKFARLDDVNIAIKISACRDRTLELETKILTKIRDDCPEISKYFARFITNVDDEFLVMERIDGEEFTEFIARMRTSKSHSTRTRSKRTIRDLSLTILCIMEQLRVKTGIVHNDLHTSNVMIVKTDEKIVNFEFADRQYTFQTHGYSPVIIDFGYAHLPGELLASLQNSDIGYSLEYPDLLADSRILLYTTFEKFDKEMKNIIKEIFDGINLDKNGWFGNEFIDVYGVLYDMAGYEPSNTMDAKLTNVVSRISGIDGDSTCEPCCDDCSLNYITDSDDTDDDHQDVIQDCQCHRSVKEMFKTLHACDAQKGCDEFSKAAEIFKPFVVEALRANKIMKNKRYSTLKVSNTLDVIDFILARISQ